MDSAYDEKLLGSAIAVCWGLLEATGIALLGTTTYLEPTLDVGLITLRASFRCVDDKAGRF